MRIAQLEEQLSIATAAQASKVRELMSTQEALALAKSELLNLRLANEEAASAPPPGMASPATPGSTGKAAQAALKGLFAKKKYTSFAGPAGSGDGAGAGK